MLSSFNKALYIFPPGFNTLDELRQGYRRSVHMEQMYMLSRSHDRRKFTKFLNRPEIMKLYREKQEKSLLPTEEPPRKAGKRSQDDEN